MIHTLEILIQKDGKTYREVFDLPKVSVDEYDSKLHSGKVFSFPDVDDFYLKENHVYLWKHASPENDEEREYLEKNGKMGFIKMRDL